MYRLQEDEFLVERSLLGILVGMLEVSPEVDAMSVQKVIGCESCASASPCPYHNLAAAPAPQAEGTNKLRVFCEIHQEYGHLCREVGAAPAETAQHERIDEEGGKHYPGETAGEMTADITISDGARIISKIEHCEGIAAKLIILRNFGERYAKQRVEQAERRCCGDAHAKLESALAMIAECGFAQKTVTHPGYVETLWNNPRAELAEAKVADLERERDTLDGKLILSSDSFLALRTELREMREALAKVIDSARRYKNGWMGVAVLEEYLTEAERLLARKAES